jgi:AcrR family transcriptional regulator
MTNNVFRSRLTRTESQAQTRERLLDSARIEVVRQGYGAASVRDIAEAAGFSQGAFYSNFASKEELLLELMRVHMADEVKTLAGFLQNEFDGADALAALERWTATMNNDADWAMLAIELQLHANRNTDFAREYDAVNAAHANALGILVGRLFAALGKVPPDDPIATARGLMALVHGLALQRAPSQPDSSGVMVMTFLRALLATAPDAS